MGNMIKNVTNLFDDCFKDISNDSYFTQQEIIYDPIARSFLKKIDEYKIDCNNNKLDTIYELSENSSLSNSPSSPYSNISSNSNTPIIYRKIF
tara:strand:+ start:2340 stop:2618 length:279 start_codon:yes stop_codon:yes gene_type:complete